MKEQTKKRKQKKEEFIMKKLTKKCNQRLCAILIAIALIFSNAGVSLAAESTDDPVQDGNPVVVADVSVPTYQEAYNLMTSLKDKYPEGKKWTNFEPYGDGAEYGEYYRFKGGNVKGASLGVGCAAFAFILSDEAFGSLPARTIDRGSFAYEDIKVGDILRVNNNSHFVVILQVSAGGVTVAEANYNKSVHWGRAISKSDIMMADFLVTRYPVGYTEDDNADEIAHSETEGSLSWTLTNSGVLTISGTGNMQNYTTDEENSPSWNEYTENINTIIIENGITSIGNYAFYQSKALTVYIPEGIKSIGDGAFQSSNLVAVTIPSTTKSVGLDAFRSCANLTSASITSGVENIGDNAFRACQSITHLDFPSSVTSIGAGTFMDCTKVVQIRFAPGTKDVTIGEGAFARCQWLMNVTLPQGMTQISSYMFQSCTSLWEIYISANVTDIGENPFTSTGIQNGGTIYFGGSEATWKSIGGQFILNSMPSAKVEYDVDFDDPFAIDPNDPGDIIFETPTEKPTDEPSSTPTEKPTDEPSSTPTEKPTDEPSSTPTEKPTDEPSSTPTEKPTDEPSSVPTEKPTDEPSSAPTEKPTDEPSSEPTAKPTVAPGGRPIAKPTVAPGGGSIARPTVTPSSEPTAKPTVAPSIEPTAKPTVAPSIEPTAKPTVEPTVKPTVAPSSEPTVKPTVAPSSTPTVKPSPTPKVTYANKAKKSGAYTYLYNSKNKKVDKFKVKNGKLTYKGKKIKNWKDVKWANFNKAGNIIVVRKNGKYYSVNHKTSKVKKLGENAKSVVKKNGIITRIVKKSGKKQNVAHK